LEVLTLANTAQAKKRARQAEKHRAHNASMRSMVRTYIKRVYSAIESGNKTLAQEAYQAAQPVLDRMARKGLIHKNKAARHKSRLSAHIKKMSGTAIVATATKAKKSKSATGAKAE
jgi:small subunit ribosomal protein S20